MNKSLVMLLVCVLLSAGVCCHGAGGSISAATGMSRSNDPMQAGTEAAQTAKIALGKRVPKVVLVFDCVGSGAADKEKLLKGVASVFDSTIVYGCSGFCPITQDGNDGTVAVMALSGRIEVNSATADLSGGQIACGKRIGYDLRQAARDNMEKTNLLILLGDCHVPADDQLVNGVKSVLGDCFNIAGAAHPLDGILYYKGKPALNSNLGLMISGDFTCGFSTKAASDSPEVVRTGGEATREALRGANGRADAALVFDCVSRLQMLGADRSKELQAIRASLGDTPILGIYGSGEIGPSSNGAPASGVGGHIVICVIAG